MHMPRKKSPLPILIENWPLPPIETYRAKVHRCRVLKKGEKNCLLGNTNFANRLLSWLQDTQEDILFQVWISYSEREKALVSHICLELEDEASEQASGWEKDIDTLLKLNDPKGQWQCAQLPNRDWKEGTILNILEHNDEPDFQESLLSDLLMLLQKNHTQTALVLSFRFQWNARTQFEKPPKIVRENPHRLRRWIRRQQFLTNHPRRSFHRRMSLLSQTPITSLLRQSAFRALAGAGQLYGRWHDLSHMQKKLISTGPAHAFGFFLPESINQNVDIDEIYGCLTANVQNGGSSERHGLPF
jgi:hypothetical protein